MGNTIVMILIMLFFLAAATILGVLKQSEAIWPDKIEKQIKESKLLQITRTKTFMTIQLIVIVVIGLFVMVY